MLPKKEEWLKALNERHGIELQRKISSATVAVCGLGGLGSNIAVLLARTGIGKLMLIDYDKVDISNLHRQQYKACQIGMNKTEALKCNLKEIAPYTETEIYTVRMDENNYSMLLEGADVICEAFDNAEEKARIVNYVLTEMPEKYLVAASGMAGMDSPNSIKTRRVTKRFYLCGDEKSDIKDGVGLVATRVCVCASHQAHTVLKIISENL